MLAGSSMLSDVPCDLSTISQDRLNIEAKSRSNLFPWNGQFSPQLVHTFLETYAVSGDRVADCFLGSGTVLVEAGNLGLRAFGAEINPAAFKMAETYTFINVNQRARQVAIATVDELLFRAFGGRSLFSDSDDTQPADIKAKLVNTWLAENDAKCRLLLETVIVLLDFYKAGLTAEKVLSTWQKLRGRVEGLPYSEAKIDLAHCDARCLPLAAESVDLVITSPPYINVFNYHQQYRASVEAMGWDLLHVARSEIGSNRKNRGNRFLTVVQYCLDITKALVELQRVCSRSARIIFVVGRESNVRKTPFFNGDIVAQLGVRCAGLSTECRQERVFTNRFGAQIYEDIIHFRPRNPQASEVPVAIAEEILKGAIVRSPEESKPDLRDALARLSEIVPSPIYQPSRIDLRNTV